MLFKEKETIKHRFDVRPDGSTPLLARKTKALEFLFRSYLPHFWYFEIIETYRRLFLTAFIAVIDPGSSFQFLCAICISYGFMRFYSQQNPYLEDQSSKLSQIAHNQIFFTYLAALFISNDLFSDETTSAVTVVLIMTLLALVCLALFFEVNNFIQYHRHLMHVATLGASTKDDRLSMASNGEDYDIFQQTQIVRVNRIKSAMITSSSRAASLNPLRETSDFELSNSPEGVVDKPTSS